MLNVTCLFVQWYVPSVRAWVCIWLCTHTNYTPWHRKEIRKQTNRLCSSSRLLSKQTHDSGLLPSTWVLTWLQLIPSQTPASQAVPPQFFHRLQCLARQGSLTPYWRNGVFSLHFNPEPGGDHLPHLRLWGCCLFSFSPAPTPLGSNIKHFRLALGEMTLGCRKWCPVLLDSTPVPFPVLDLSLGSKRAAL